MIYPTRLLQYDSQSRISSCRFASMLPRLYAASTFSPTAWAIQPSNAASIGLDSRPDYYFGTPRSSISR
jgi:hypothetical protein